jgi:hypothetical protein
MLKHTMVLRNGQFIGRPTRMGKKVVIIIPTEYHDEIEKVMNQVLKVSWEEILDRNGKGSKK